MPDEAAVRKVDGSDIVDDVAALPDQLLRGVALGRDVGAVAANRSALIAGMGGSAIAAEVLAAWLGAERGIAVPVVKDLALPAFVGESHLAVVVSYSGNTRETLAATRDAMARGCDVVGISSGGALQALCAKRGFPFVPLPPGLMPRAAFGFVFGTLAAIFGATDRDEVPRAADILRERGPAFAPSVTTAKNPAKALAGRLVDRTPVIYATPTYGPVARRWQTQLNENAKVLAWASILPEADHNELVGWSEDPAATRFAPIFLRDPEESAEHARMIDATRDLVAEKAKVEEVRAEGPTLLARMLTTIQLGDWTSVYLAVLRRVDPTPVAVIDRLKERLARGE